VLLDQTVEGGLAGAARTVAAIGAIGHATGRVQNPGRSRSALQFRNLPQNSRCRGYST
jgi:hypothetical protein